MSPRPRLLVVLAAIALFVAPLPARASVPTHAPHHGVAPPTGAFDNAPAPGWAGERLFGRGNDWEPDVAADPSAPFVYVVTTRYSGEGPLPCERCDLPAIALKVSADDGVTFGPVRFMPVNTTGGQYDPQIETDATGNVYAVWIDGNFRDVFSTSTDHGQTWSTPVIISRHGGWADHPWLGVSPNGQHVYVGFNHQASWVAQSHDGGATWLPAVQTSHTDRYFYANGTVVQNNGDVAISQESYPLDSHFTGPIKVVVTRSLDGGATFQTATVDTVQQQPDCANKGCPHDHYGGMAALAGDANGTMLLAYTGALVPKGPQYIFTRTSTDGGATWTDRTRVSPGGDVIASFPAVAGTGSGDFRLTWMDDRNGIRRWNSFFRRSVDAGVTFSPSVDISDARAGARYVFPRGFEADYGDYQAVTIMNDGRTFAAWAEGTSYYGPGGTWMNNET
jgi:hypothetical protein